MLGRGAGGRQWGDRRDYRAVVAIAGMARRVFAFGGGKEGYAPSGLGCAGGGRCWGLK